MAITLRSDEFRGFDRPLHILLVDRDENTRSVHAEFLRQWECVAEETGDGREALAKAIGQRPDAIVVTANRLPGMGGLDLCRVLRRDVVTSTVPIVIITSDISDAEMRRAIRAGASSVLAKPCEADRLALEIEQMLQSAPPSDVALEPNLRVINGPIVAPEKLDEPALPPRRVMLNHVHGRRMTTAPVVQPPGLMCPTCYGPLQYVKSFIGGVSERHPEQWDYFNCPTGCGTFQYRHRTRKLRQIN